MTGLLTAGLIGMALHCAPEAPPGTLLSIAWTESGLNPSVRDNINRDGSRDRGIAQVNQRNWSRLGLTPVTALDPCESLRAAAVVLLENYHPRSTDPIEQQRALRVAIAAYNAGPNGGPNLSYVHKVEDAARRIIPELAVAGIDPPPPPTSKPPPPPPCAPSWDAWALATCSTHQTAKELSVESVLQTGR